MREQSGFYERPAKAPGVRRRPQNTVKPSSPRKKAPPDLPTKTPAPTKGAKGRAGKDMAPKTSRQEAKVRRKVRGP